MRGIRSQRSHREFLNEFEQEQAQRREQELAPINATARRVAELELQIAEAERQTALRELLDKPSALIEQKCPKYVPTEFQTAEQVTAAIGDAWNTFRLSLAERGIKITPEAQGKFTRILSLNKSVDSRQAKTFMQIYEVIEALNGWSDREVTKPAVV